MNLLQQLQESGFCYDEKIDKDRSEYVVDVVRKWLKENRQEQETKILVHSNKVNRQLMIDDLLKDLGQ